MPEDIEEYIFPKFLTDFCEHVFYTHGAGKWDIIYDVICSGFSERRDYKTRLLAHG
jgi:hypothetical protein